MGGCPNGAVPTAFGLNTQQLLDKAALGATLATLIRTHQPTSFAAFTASLVDVNALCASNPDPPQPLTAGDFVNGLSYFATPETAVSQTISRYIYEWLRYQAFTQFCVCNGPTVDPALNCLHARNVTVPAGANQIVPLGTIVIQPEVYDSWIATPNTWRIEFNGGQVTTSGLSNNNNWDFQLQYSNGVWTDFIRGDALPENGFADFQYTLQGGFGTFPRSVATRIHTRGGTGSQLASYDVCFKPTVAAPSPIPPQPDLPTLPVVGTPVCSTDDLCAIVQELARQLTRVSGEVSDILAALGGTSTRTVLSSTPITGEGEITLPVGARAISIELTTLGPGVFTSALGRPRGLMRAGSIRWGDGVGYSEREFIDADRFDRERAPGALSLSWQLINGCAGTLKFLG